MAAKIENLARTYYLRLDVADAERVADLTALTNLNASDVLRLALRNLASEKGINVQ